MNFRADINGLRAIAVLAVVLFHFDVKGFHGGYVGVDVFFVISGFLMTGIILRRLDLHKFHLLEFYVERARRIVPALLPVCFTLLAGGWFFLFPVEYQELAKHTVGAVTFTSNFMFAKSAGYFEPGSIEKWLLHTWSLSTEWQFYLLYPLLLMALTRHFSSRSVRGVLTVAVIACLALSIWLTLNMPTDAFYLLPARIWELMAGGLIFLFPLKLNSRYQRILEWLGLGMIAYACVRFRPADAWPGWLACVPVFGACFVIASSRPSSLLTGNRFSQFIGKCSYSIYLWHWPIVVALHHFGRSRQAGWTIAGLALSIVLGQISYAFVENAMRGKRLRGEVQKKSFIHAAISPLALGAAAVTLFGLIVYVTQGVANDYRMPDIAERQRFVVSYQNDLANRRPRAYRFECSFFDEEHKSVRQSIDPSCTAVGGKRAVFLWGDSYAQALSHGLRTLYPGRVSQVATAACRPRLRAETVFEKAPIVNNCDLSNHFALTEIERLKPETVVLTQSVGFELTDWNEFADRLRSAGVSRIVLAGPLPRWEPPLPMLIARKHWLKKSDGYLRDGLDKNSFSTDRFLSELYGKSQKLTYVSMLKTLCIDFGCLGYVPGTQVLTSFDYGHLTPEGSIYAVSAALSESLLFAP